MVKFEKNKQYIIGRLHIKQLNDSYASAVLPWVAGKGNRKVYNGSRIIENGYKTFEDFIEEAPHGFKAGDTIHLATKDEDDREVIITELTVPKMEEPELEQNYQNEYSEEYDPALADQIRHYNPNFGENRKSSAQTVAAYESQIEFLKDSLNKKDQYINSLNKTIDQLRLEKETALQSQLKAENNAQLAKMEYERIKEINADLKKDNERLKGVETQGLADQAQANMMGYITQLVSPFTQTGAIALGNYLNKGQAQPQQPINAQQSQQFAQQQQQQAQDQTDAGNITDDDIDGGI